MKRRARASGRSPAAAPPAPLVVGVGASAGGLDACERLLRGIPAGSGLGIVVVLHLAPEQPSHVAQILQRSTAMTVTQVAGGERVERDHVYVIAPGTALGIADGVLVVEEPEKPHYRACPIDAFLGALAADRGAGSAAVVLSGGGNDGSAGLASVAAAGGLCLVQEPSTAAYASMPSHAIESGAAAAVVAPESMGELLVGFAATGAVPRAPAPAAVAVGGRAEEAAVAEAPAPTGGDVPHAAGRPDEAVDAAPQRVTLSRGGLGAILDLLADRCRVDFRDYKRGTLQRRIARRMRQRDLVGWQSYLEHLAADPAEVEALYRDLLIGVTSFFRDREAWEHLSANVMPALLAEPNRGGARLWSAGCASGEEPYGLAIVTFEHLKESGDHREVRVFASDASPAALDVARRGYYPRSIERAVGAARLGRFFRASGDGYVVERGLRSAVTFAVHDLLGDPPFPDIDLIACRNVLIYLEPAAQEQLLERLHFALRPGGVLWLGAAETVGRRDDLFTPLDGDRAFHRATPKGRPRPYHLATRRERSRGRPEEAEAPLPEEEAGRVKTPRLVERLVLQRHVTPCVVVGGNLEILYFFGDTEPYLKRPAGEVRLDLLSWVRPELYATVRTGITKALEQGRPVTLECLRLDDAAASKCLEIAIEPVPAGVRPGGMVLVAFREVSTPPAPSPAGEHDSATPAELRGAKAADPLRRELQDTREQLARAVDQLRTTTEDHAANHEEMLSLNEELQSSNEELEASKEELQSLNEELSTTNRQLEDRNDELRTLTSDLDNLIASSQLPAAFFDRELRLRRSTPSFDAMMRAGSAALGKALADIPLRVEDDGLLADAASVLADSASRAAEVAGEGGRWFTRQARPYRTVDGEVNGVCITFQEITALKEEAAASEYARLYAEAIIRTSRTPLVVLDIQHRVVSANDAFYSTFAIDEAETVGRRIYELGNGQWAIPRVRALLEEAPARRNREVRDYDVEHMFEHIGWRSMRLNADVMPRTGRPDLILLSIEDVTDLRKAEMKAQAHADDLARDHKRKDTFLAMLGHELRNPLSALVHGLELLGTPGESADARAMMSRQARRMTAMLDQVLDVSRVISGKLELQREAADVAEAARAAVESIRPQLETAGHQLEVSLPPAGTALVLGDAARLSQVTENLLANAGKYTPPGGHIRLSLAVADDTLELSVRDDGIGVDPALLGEIFDLFTQASAGLHRARGGLGLGLALVRDLVQMHGGSVEAFSAGAGKGTEVVVTLPRLRASRPLKQPGEAIAVALPARRILVVDDEVDAGAALAEILGIHGHVVEAVVDGEAALAAAARFDPEIALLDLGLPEMDGYEVARRLRNRHGRRITLVALSGYQGDPARLQKAGFDGHLLKPTSLDELLAFLAGLPATGERPAAPAGT